MEIFVLLIFPFFSRLFSFLPALCPPDERHRILPFTRTSLQGPEHVVSREILIPIRLFPFLPSNFRDSHVSADSGSSLKGQKTIDEMKRWKGILMVVNSLVTPAVVPHSIEKEKERDIFSVEPICAAGLPRLYRWVYTQGIVCWGEWDMLRKTKKKKKEDHITSLFIATDSGDDGRHVDPAHITTILPVPECFLRAD